MVKALISQREVANRYGGFSDSLEREYIDYFTKLGITVFPVSNFCDIGEILKLEWNLIILTGGGILPTSNYNYSREGIRQSYRDKVEDILIQHAVEFGIPLIGICRGMQKINAFFGGKVCSFDECTTLREIKKVHPVETNTGERFLVNNYHNDGLFLESIARGLIPIAIDPDNKTIEAFLGHKILGVQWHPERLGNDEAADNWMKRQIDKLLLIVEEK